jgi:TonB-dependent starch-binding outer membrane protein SusC
MKIFRDYCERNILEFFSKRTFRVMKLTLFLSILTISQLWATETYSQLTKLTLKLENVKIADALKEIENNSEFFFLYSPKLIDVERKVNIDADKEPIKDILNNIFGEKVNFAVYDRQIILTPNDMPGVLSEFQQQKQISGKVTDENGNPMPGVNIKVEGTTTGAISDINGMYSVNVPGEDAALSISFIGYNTEIIPVAGKATIDIVLTPALEGLDEVVVVGYGTQKKKDFTGAVAHLSSQQMENKTSSNVQNLLMGNIPGLNVSFNSSAKGGGSLQIRGRSSLNAGTSPLLVVDGVIYDGSLDDINPSDIENVDVLKDASSSAVYGAKAANGIVLITTKKGNSSKPVISFNTSLGLATMEVNQKPFNPQEFMNWRQNVMENIYVNHQPYQFSDPRNLPSGISVNDWLAYTGSTGDPVTIWLQRLNFQDVQINNYLAGKTIDWYDEVYRTGIRQDHTISLSGKKDEVSYYMSMEYLNNEGIIVGDKFSTIRGRLNLEGKATKFMTAGINLQFADKNESQVPANSGRVVTNSPYGSKYNEDGTLKFSPDSNEGGLLTSQARNPFLEMEYTDRLQKTRTLFSVIYLKGDLPLGFSYQVNFTPSYSTYKYFNANSSKNLDYTQIGGSATRRNNETFNWQIDNILKWNKTFNDIHRFDVTLLANAEKNQSWQNSISNQGFQPNDKLSYHNIGSGINPVVSSSDTYSTGDALMARLNYSLNQRYLLTLSVRRDGYSAFGQKNPRATFPAVALGWVLGDEKFLNSANWLNYAKLRFSYGINGNRDIGEYQAISDLATGKYLYSTPSGTVYQVTQLYVNRMSNTGLKWEKTTSYNFGLDFTVFDNFLNGSLDLYKKSTSDLLVLRSLPNITGFNNVMDNLGEVQNKGIELNLNTNNIDHTNFSWKSTINFTVNRNKIIHLYGPVNILDESGNVIGKTEPDDASNGWFIGHDIGSIWDLKVLGVWQVDEKDEAAKYGVRPGDFKLEDVDKDYLYTDADRQFLGYRTPRFSWTLSNEFTFYKNFDLSFMIYSNLGQKSTFNWAKNATEYLFPDKSNNYKLPYWTPENPINDFAATNSSTGGAIYNVYRNTSFVRLRDVTLAYTLPKALAQKAHMENLKVYVNITNAAFFAPGLHFWDPENQGPTPRYFTMGINLTL